MARHERVAAKQLDHYWDAVVDPASAGPTALDTTLAETVQHLDGLADAPAPDPDFAATLRQALLEDARLTPSLNGHRPPASAPQRSAFRLPATLLAAAAVLLLAVIGLGLWASRPATVDAAEIVQKARAALTTPDASGVHSFVLEETTTTAPGLRRGAGGVTTQTSYWFEAPNRWRIEARSSIPEADDRRGIVVSDGTNVWKFDETSQHAAVTPYEPAMDGQVAQTPFGALASDLGSVFQQASTCYTPTLRGTATIAGRPVYEVDLGPSKCPSASVPDVNGRQVIWIDQETFFVLKRVLYDASGSQPLSTTEVASVQYNVPIDPARFSFTPPPGATVEDFRPKPAPSATEYRQQLEQIAAQVEFPVFVPHDVPAGLVPLAPRRIDVDGAQVELHYVPAAEAGSAVAAGAHGISIIQQQATTDTITSWTDRTERIEIAGGPGWLLRGSRNVDGTGTASSAIVLRDGTLISVTSFDVAPEALVGVAASLEPVPGGHAPLPNPPLPPAAADQSSPTAVPPPSFRILRPTWLPEEMTVREQYEATSHGSGIVIGFDPRPNDRPHDILQLREVPAGARPADEVQDPQASRESIGGREVTIIRRGQGCVTAEWVQDGVALTLTNPYDPPGPPGQVRYSCDQFRRIIESIR